MMRSVARNPVFFHVLAAIVMAKALGWLIRARTQPPCSAAGGNAGIVRPWFVGHHVVLDHQARSSSTRRTQQHRCMFSRRHSHFQNRLTDHRLTTNDSSESTMLDPSPPISRLRSMRPLLGKRIGKILRNISSRIRVIILRRRYSSIYEETTAVDSSPAKRAVLKESIQKSLTLHENTVLDEDHLRRSRVTMHLDPGSGTRSQALPTSKRLRSAESSPEVDLSGHWNIIVTDEFKRQYDQYLLRLGQPAFVRSVALSIVPLTTEETFQSDHGRKLFIRGRNVRFSWERTLLSSDLDIVVEGEDIREWDVSAASWANWTKITTAEHETVPAAAWWESEGQIHRSWLMGVQKYGGGHFESKRYLEHGRKVLVCESTFHPNDERREKAHITWRFLRQGATL